MHYGSGSVVPSRSAGFTNTGSPRPARPGQLDQMMADNIAGGADPAEINEMCHASAAALLDRVHHTQDAELVERVLTLVDREGVDVIAELWSHADPDSLPGILWRLYLLRTWMRKNRESIARLWRVGEPVATTASAIAGVDQAPTEDDIARTADSILAGAFTGDFAVALERAAAFTDVVALGLRIEARKLASLGGSSEAGSSDVSDGSATSAAADSRPSAVEKRARAKATCSPRPRISATGRICGGADDWNRPFHCRFPLLLSTAAFRNFPPFHTPHDTALRSVERDCTIGIRAGPCIAPGSSFCRCERPLRRQALSWFGAFLFLNFVAFSYDFQRLS